ncbi:MAG: HK97 gp10 family phage protein [Phycisphaerae bacterium]|nr:HK97 gp10 family phage protein [Phycisphaerae bacterium]
MPTIAIKAELSGQRITLQALEQVRGSTLKAALRSAMRKIGSVISQAAKSHVAVETGTLRKSIGYRVFTKHTRMGVVIGPRRGFDAAVRQLAPRGGKKGGVGRIRRMTKKQLAAGVRPDEIRKPTRIAHLIEKGRKAVEIKKKKILLDQSGDVIGRKAAAAPAKPFLAPAYQANKGLAEDLVASEIRAALRKVWGDA